MQAPIDLSFCSAFERNRVEKLTREKEANNV